jgi:hypothetical protein
MTSYFKMVPVQEKAMCVLLVFGNEVRYQNAKRRCRTQHGECPPSDNAIRRWLKRVVVFCTQKGGGRPSMIESRKRLLEAHKHYAVLFLHIIKPSKLQFYIPSAVLFCLFRFEYYRPRKPRQ